MDKPTENLELVADGSRDIAVGISGFGSASLDASRWDFLSEMTGRTTYSLRYDAQQLPWDQVPRSLLDMVEMGGELRKRWLVARMAAAAVSEFLANWIIRWVEQGRRVLVVGFSLGGYVAWRAVQQAIESVGGESIDLVLVSAALGDRTQNWQGIEQLHHLVNIYSIDDIVLKYLYPMGVSGDDTPAAGLGPIVIRGPNIDNIDATDMIGRDHLWAAVHLSRVVRVGLACVWGRSTVGACLPPDVAGRLAEDRGEELSLEAYARLLRWTVIDEQLWRSVGGALEGDELATARVAWLDRWSMQRGRLAVLLESSEASRALLAPEFAAREAHRGRQEIAGVLRMWIASSS